MYIWLLSGLPILEPSGTIFGLTKLDHPGTAIAAVSGMHLVHLGNYLLTQANIEGAQETVRKGSKINSAKT